MSKNILPEVVCLKIKQAFGVSKSLFDFNYKVIKVSVLLLSFQNFQQYHLFEDHLNL